VRRWAACSRRETSSALSASSGSERRSSHQGRIPLIHADLYRLTGSAELDGTGFHELRDGPGATLVEWADRVPGAAPQDALHIVFEEPSESTRSLVVTASGPRAEHLLGRWKDELLGRSG